MKDEILKRVDALAEKLGVASGELWKILVQQAHIVAIQTGVEIVICGAISIVGYRWMRRGFAAAEEDDWDSFPAVMIGGLLMFFGGTLFAIVNLIDVWTPLLNPQYWALQQILETIKGAAK
jgi:hypothetical protein